MFCNKCGKELDNNATHCPFCNNETVFYKKIKESQIADDANANTADNTATVTEGSADILTTTDNAVKESVAPAVNTVYEAPYAPAEEMSYEAPCAPAEDIVYETPAESAPKKAKKSKKGLIIGLIIAAVILVGVGIAAAFTGFFGLFKRVKPGTPEDMFKAIYNVADSDSFTVNASYKYAYKDGDGNVTDEDAADIVLTVDAANHAFSSEMKSTLEADNGTVYTYSYSNGTNYTYQSSDGSAPRGTKVVHSDKQREYYNDQFDDILRAIKLISKGDSSGLSELGLDSDTVKAFSGIVSSLLDEEWMKENFGFASEVDGSTRIYTLTPDLNALIDAVAEDGPHFISDVDAAKETVNGYTVTIKLTESDDYINTFDIELTSEDVSATISGDISKIDDSSVDTEGLDSKIGEANDGITECKECKSPAVYFKGYCEKCAEDYMCKEFCGNEQYRFGYCESCYSPCSDCGKNQADEAYNGMCYSCHSEKYCSKCFDKEVTHVYEITEYGYCDDCYAPCPECGQAQASESYKGLCYSCHRSKYCYACNEKEVTHTLEYSHHGYCDDCYVLCSNCNDSVAAENCDGQCYSCWREKYCYKCHENDPVHWYDEDEGYCDDCYEPCAECGEYQATYLELCYQCYAKDICSNYNCDNPVQVYDKDGDGYCSSCYRPCKGCGKEQDMDDSFRGYCYDCKMTKFCQECNLEAKHLASGEYGSSVGYCELCFSPCKNCNIDHGREELKGMCQACFTEKFCNVCLDKKASKSNDGIKYCKKCYYEEFCAADCGEKHSKEAPDGKKYCEKCFKDKYCNKCEKNEATRTVSATSGKYCDDCYKNVVCAAGCGELNEKKGPDGKIYCVTCYFKKYCKGCEVVPATRTVKSTSDKYCDDCYQNVVCAAGCGELNEKKGPDGKTYCLTCYFKKYCKGCEVARATKTIESYGNYCDTCYEKIACANDCGRAYSQSGPDGNKYCSTCFNYKYCNSCKTNEASKSLNDARYCTDCYYASFCSNDCGNSYSKTGPDGNKYCSSCFYDKYCNECEVKEATKSTYYSNYCSDCYYETYCANDCGSTAYYDGPNGKSYCYSCYNKLICNACEEKEATKSSGYSYYCDDCYNERYCSNCGDYLYYSSNSVDGKTYCSDCYNDLFCCECGTNKATITYNDDNYCSSCFTYCTNCKINRGNKDHSNKCWGCYYYGDSVCPECYDDEGESYYQGYCSSSCLYKNNCYSCETKAAKHWPKNSNYGYCGDCFDPCKNCGVNQADSYYDGFCSGCYYYRDNVCKSCYDNSASYGDKCYSCYYYG